MPQINNHQAPWPFDGGEPLPLPPPCWASRSMAEDGGIVHEAVSPFRPTSLRWAPHGTEPVITEVGLSTTDVRIDGTWIRARPTVQVEGGSFPLDSARELHAALGFLLAAAAAEGKPEADPRRRASTRRARFESLQMRARG